MIFDQYSRYKACSDFLYQTEFRSGNSVLDIGSGPECLFGQFMPNATMNYVDPLIPNGSGQGHITGNIFASELEGQTFDCVSAVDVLEHVPPEYRQAFLERMSSLGNNALLLGFPTSDSSDASETDRAIDEQYRAFFGHNYPWLEEHYRYGLPSLVKTVEQLSKLGWHCQSIGHGHAPWLRELLGFVICLWDIPGLQKVVLDISDKFNRELYSCDFRPPYYRQFVIASRNPLPPIIAPIGTKKSVKAESAFRALIEDAHRQYFSASMQQLVNFSGIFTERDTAIAERDTAIAERDTAITERDTAVALINLIKRSTSWRITQPLRFLARLARYGFSNEDRQRLTQGLRNRYHRLPLPTHAKKLSSFFYHKVFGKIVRKVRRSSLRKAKFHTPTIKIADQHEGLPDYIVWGVIDWHFRHQRPQQLVLALSETSRRVFYVSPNLVDDERAGFEVEALEASDRLFQIRLFVNGAPSIYTVAPNQEIVGQLRASIGEVLDWTNSKQLVAMVQHPYWCDVASVLPNSRLVYDCMDHHEGFGNTGKTLVQLEKALFGKSDLTITTSDWLDKEVAQYTQHRALIRNAGDYGHFSRPPESIYRDPTGRRIIGYYGAIAEWFDLKLVEAVAKHHSDCCILLIGADTANAKYRLGKLPNIKFIGEVPYNKLPYYLYSFDVCLLPFHIVPLTLATNPVKAYEYLSAGKPIVSVDLPEMVQFDGLIYIAANQAQFLNAVDQVLTRSEPKDLIQRRKVFAAGQTWNHRAEVLIKHAESSEYEARVSVIVATYNNLALTRACLASLDDHSQYDNMEIIVVDNASSDGSKHFLENWASAGDGRKLILNDDNCGFAAANNQGLCIATGDFLVLLNNDTYVTPGWVRTLMGHLKRDKSIGLIGPVTNNIGNEAKIDIHYSDMSEMLVKSATYIYRHIGQIYPLRTAAFFCVMMNRATYERVGPLDEAFGRGFFEDDDYCRRIEKLGLRVVCAEDVFIHHELSASFDMLKQQERQELFEENKKIYEAKWGEWVRHGYRKNHFNEPGSYPAPEVFAGQKSINGQCNVCGKQTRFFYQKESLWRESLNCEHCRTTSRYRSITRGILQAINELTGNNSTSLATLPLTGKKRLRVYDTQLPFYYETCAYPLPDLLKVTGLIEVELSQYKPKKLLGKVLAKGVTNQNLECLTFDNESFDIVITSDVMEHVRLDDRAHNEIHRVLKPGGIYIFTIPHNRAWHETLNRIQVIDPEDPSRDVHLLEPEYHGDANNDEGVGVLAYRTYGKDIESQLSRIGFEVNYSREDMSQTGILNTELYYCRKIGNS
ncbi:glycosyltransferase [Desulfopila sp. IMCC35006]|uniref:glycosyltransferase n=1 Tax=Desulfopila sp. IMCC35006 TaxID=2569542 RepID=UPI00142EF0E3|nr:glycosyltransferase [Desulfopila sp. IMCC35006]